MSMLEGYVGSADTGSEELVRASRAALASYCESNTSHPIQICATLFDLMKLNLDNDRILVPTMEVMAFLFDVQIIQSSGLKYLPPRSITPLASISIN